MRAMIAGAVRLASAARWGRTTSSVLQASVCQRTAIAMVVGCLVSVTSLMSSRRSCLRSAAVVVGAYHTSGTSWASARIRARSSLFTTSEPTVGCAAYSRSRRSSAVSFSFQSRSKLRATRRFSGSTAT